MTTSARTAARLAAVLAIVAVFGAPSSDLLPTVGGDAHAATTTGASSASIIQSHLSSLLVSSTPCEFTDPWMCVNRDSDGDGIPDIQDACPNQPGEGDGCPGNAACAAGYVMMTWGFYAGWVGFLAPEPVVSKVWSAAGWAVGLAGAGVAAANCP